MKDVKGKTAFITGAAAGIGLGMAEAFAEAGMNVVITDIEEAVLNDARERLAGGSDADRVHAIGLDVADRDAMARAADEAEEKFGRLHVICNNAGVTSRGRLEDATYDDWDWVLGVNLGGVVNGLRTFVPRLKAHGEGGHIVNTASIAGLLASPGNGVYAASKFAIVGLSEGLRQELGPDGIGVSVLCPGLVDTQIHNAARNRPGRFAEARRAASPEQVDILDRSMKMGMKPRELGGIVLDAIIADAAYILPHGEFKDAFKKKSEAILAAFSGQAPDSKRLEGMELRARGFAEYWSDGGGEEFANEL